MKELNGRVALVTGGASGIGFGIARALLSSGMHVVIADVREDHMAKAMADLRGDSCHFLRLDVADRSAWRRAAEEVGRLCGKLHLLCNNAGIGVLKDLRTSTRQDWDWLMGVNLRGVIYGVTAMLPLIRAHGEGGHIMATSSMGGLIVGESGGIYSAGKFGVVAYMECLRQDLASENIGVSVLCPAAVNTNIFDHATMRPGLVAGAAVPERDGLDPEIAKRLLAQGRNPLEVGDMVREAILRNDPYIFTDRRVQADLAARRDALFAAASA